MRSRQTETIGTEDVFHNARIPELYAGRGAAAETLRLLRRYGINGVCLVTGVTSYDRLPDALRQETLLRSEGIACLRYPVSGEPSPETVDRIRDEARKSGFEAVIAVGGGSVLDTGKAVAAMLCHTGSVADYLEGVGTLEPTGIRKPFIALPTTAGTGSEATKNAVISRTGNEGFKKSLRHEAFVPDAAILDPELSRFCPPGITAASGLDAVTQLLEAYVSVNATPFTSMCALEGLTRAGRWLETAIEEGDNLEARTQMAYAAYLSGIALASAGLGVVHGAAGVLGGMRPIPHGVVCGSLLKEATERILSALQKQPEEKSEKQESNAGILDGGLDRYTRAAEALTGCGRESPETAREELLKRLERWIDLFDIPRLGAYGFTAEELSAASSWIQMKKSPVELGQSEIEAMLTARL